MALFALVTVTVSHGDTVFTCQCCVLLSQPEQDSDAKYTMAGEKMGLLRDFEL